MQDRIVRIPLPISLIRKMDELILSNQGGFATRTDFIQEAISNLVTELTYGEAPELGEVEPTAEGVFFSMMTPASLDRADRIEEAPRRSAPPSSTATLDWSASALEAPPHGPHLENGIEQIDRDEALYGLHNRDYPSLWAARMLALLNGGHPLPFEAYAGAVVDAAWEFGAVLERIGKTMHTKTTYLFPTNREKPQSAEEGFKAFAVGTATRLKDGSGWKADGPLFAWRLAHLERRDDTVFIGPSEHLYELLHDLDGITVREPHEPDHARAFFEHVREHAPGDWWGFRKVLEYASGSTRADLLARLDESRPEWTPAQRDTNAAGYVARLREWGLLEPKQAKGIYPATDLGKAMLDEWMEDDR